MSFTIRNISAGPISIDDLGIDILTPGGEYNLQSEEGHNVAISEDLPALVSANQVAVLDPLDNSTPLSTANALVAIQNANSPNYRIFGGTLNQLDDVTVTSPIDGDFLRYQGGIAVNQSLTDILSEQNYFASDATVTTTNSTTFITKLSLSAPVVEAGNYVIDFSYSWNTSSSNSNIEVGFLRDALPIGETFVSASIIAAGNFSGTGNEQKYFASKRFIFPLVAQTYTFTLQFRSSASNRNASLWDTSIVLRRLN